MPPKKKADPGPIPKRPKTMVDYFGNKSQVYDSDEEVQFAQSHLTSPSKAQAQNINIYVTPGHEAEAKRQLKNLPPGVKITVQGGRSLDDIPDAPPFKSKIPNQPAVEGEDITPTFCMPYDAPPVFKVGKRQSLQEAHEINIDLEEGLFAKGLDRMLKTATSRVKVSKLGDESTKDYCVPTCQQLQIACTILVHPDFTTSVRRWEEDKPKDRRAAWRVLKKCITTFSPANLRMEEVIKTRIEYKSKLGAMAAEKARSRKAARQGKGDAARVGCMSELFDGEEVCDSFFVQDECVFNQGGDIWELVAWMFSTSVKHKKRWKYYKKLAELMVDTWDVDWYRCVNKYDDFDSKLSMFVAALPQTGGTAGFNRCIDATWARGEKEWRPWFENETKKYRERQWQPYEVEPLADEARQMDPDEEISDEEVDLEDDGFLDPAAGLGGKDAVDLRCRLMALIASVSDYGFFGEGNTLAVFEGMRDHYSRLFFPQWHFLVTSPDIALDESFRSALNQLMIEDFLTEDSYFYAMGDNKKKAKKGDPKLSEAAEAEQEEFLDPFIVNQNKILKCFVPYGAMTSSIVANAKMNVLVEQLIQSLIDTDKFMYTTAFEDAVWTGIAARREALLSGDSPKRVEKKMIGREDARVIELLNEISELNMKQTMMEQRRKLWERMNGTKAENFSAEEKKVLADKMEAMRDSDASLEKLLEVAHQKLDDYKTYRQQNEKEIQAKKDAEKAEKEAKRQELLNKRTVKQMKKDLNLNSEDEKLLLSPPPKPRGRGRPPKKKPAKQEEEEQVYDDVPIINPVFKFNDEDLDKYDSDEDTIDPFTGKVTASIGHLKKTRILPTPQADLDTLMDEEADLSKLGLKIANSDDEEGDSDDDLEFTPEQRRLMDLKEKHNRNLKEIFNEESDLSDLSGDEEGSQTLDTITLLRQIGVELKR